MSQEDGGRALATLRVAVRGLSSVRDDREALQQDLESARAVNETLRAALGRLEEEAETDVEVLKYLTRVNFALEKKVEAAVRMLAVAYPVMEKLQEVRVPPNAGIPAGPKQRFMDEWERSKAMFSQDSGPSPFSRGQ